jgi:hypothetical protein
LVKAVESKMWYVIGVMSVKAVENKMWYVVGVM